MLTPQTRWRITPKMRSLDAENEIEAEKLGGVL